MSKLRFKVKADKFRSQKSRILEMMANNAVRKFKVEAFDKRGLDGDKWKPNKINEGRQQLVNTGRMRASITILKRTQDAVIVGTNVPYAVYHNKGTYRLPKRTFIGKSKSLEEENKKLLMREVSKIA